MRMGQGGDGEWNGGERLRDVGFSVAVGWGWQRQVGMALGLGMGLGMARGALGIESEVSVVAVAGNSVRNGKRLGFGHEVQGCFPVLGSYVRSGFHQVTRRTPS